jgi:hypothetical protein
MALMVNRYEEQCFRCTGWWVRMVVAVAQLRLAGMLEWGEILRSALVVMSSCTGAKERSRWLSCDLTVERMHEKRRVRSGEQCEDGVAVLQDARRVHAGFKFRLRGN